MKKVLYLSAFLFSLQLSAQISFQKTFGDIDVDDAQAVVQTTDLGYCMVGQTGSSQIDSTDIAVYRLDPFGSILWTTRLHLSKDDYVTDIKQTSDLGFIIVGSTASSPNDTVNSDIMAIKIDDAGFPVWAYVYGGADYDEAQSVIVANDGGYVICGNTASYSVPTSAFILKINSSGNQQWCNISYLTTYNYFYRLDKTPGNGYIAGGGTYNGASTGLDHYICKFDSNGALTWGNRYGTPLIDLTYDIKTTSDSGYIVVGNSFSNGAGREDQNVFKLSSNGSTVLFNKNFGTAQNDRATGVVENPDGSFSICGYTNIGDTANIINQMVIEKLNSAGGLVWASTYGDPLITGQGNSIVHTNDNGFASCGFTYAFSDPMGDAYLVKTDTGGNSYCGPYQTSLALTTNTNTFSTSGGPFGQLITIDENPVTVTYFPFINQFTQVCLSDKIHTRIQPAAWRVYPNPAHSTLNIERENDNEPMSLTIVDVFGQVVFVGNNQAGEKLITVDIETFASGVYTVIYQTSSERSFKKFIKE